MYVGTVKVPEVGWRAFFLQVRPLHVWYVPYCWCQVTVKGPRDTVYEFTTQVNIVPDTFPFPECHGAGCRGKLV